MLKRLKSVTARAVIASLLMTTAAPVLAQEAAQSAPESGAWVALAMGIVFFAAVCVGCFMSPRRSHQD